jgi:hypothetical protein
MERNQGWSFAMEASATKDVQRSGEDAEIDADGVILQ